MWRCGVGAVLVEKATHQARLRGLALTVTANPHALGILREAAGFRSKARRRPGSGPALRMSR